MALELSFLFDTIIFVSSLVICNYRSKNPKKALSKPIEVSKGLKIELKIYPNLNSYFEGFLGIFMKKIFNKIS